MSIAGDGSGRAAARERRRLTTGVKDGLRGLGVELSLLNRRVGAALGLRDSDMDCLDLVARHGPLSPTALARLAGLHPATMTGVLDRLERGGWVVRERDPGDRRAVLVRELRDRNAEMFALFAGMNGRVEEILAAYGSGELEVIADFLRRTAAEGRAAAADLARPE